MIATSSFQPAAALRGRRACRCAHSLAPVVGPAIARRSGPAPPAAGADAHAFEALLSAGGQPTAGATAVPTVRPGGRASQAPAEDALAAEEASSLLPPILPLHRGAERFAWAAPDGTLLEVIHRKGVSQDGDTDGTHRCVCVCQHGRAAWAACVCMGQGWRARCGRRLHGLAHGRNFGRRHGPAMYRAMWDNTVLTLAQPP
jgi:hypothetical protein